MKLLLYIFLLFSTLHADIERNFNKDKVIVGKLLENSGVKVKKLSKSETKNEILESYKIAVQYDWLFDHLVMKTLFSTLTTSQSKFLKETLFKKYSFNNMAFQVNIIYKKENKYLTLDAIMTHVPDFLTNEMDKRKDAQTIQKLIDDKIVHFNMEIDYLNSKESVRLKDIDQSLLLHTRYSENTFLKQIKIIDFSYIKDGIDSILSFKELSHREEDEDFTYKVALKNYKQTKKIINFLSQSQETSIEQIVYELKYTGTDQYYKQIQVNDKFSIKNLLATTKVSTSKATTTYEVENKIDEVVYKSTDNTYILKGIELKFGIENLRSSSLIELDNYISSEHPISSKYLIRAAMATLLHNKLYLNIHKFRIENMVHNKKEIKHPLNVNMNLMVDAKDIEYSQLKKTPYILFSRIKGESKFSIARELMPFIEKSATSINTFIQKYQKVEGDYIIFNTKLQDTIMTINNKAIQ